MTRAQSLRGASAAGLIALLLALLVGAFSLASAGPAGAAESACDPSPDKPCVMGTLRSDKGLVEGVKITVTAPDGTESEATTDDKGLWSVPSNGDGAYKAVLDKESLPDGIGSVGATERTVLVKKDGKRDRFIVLFEVRTGDYSSQSSKMDLLLQSAASGLRLGLLLALAAVGLSIIYGTTGLASFSHAEQVTMGGIVAFMMVNWWGVPFLLACVLTILVCGATGYLQDRLMWQPLRHRGLGLVQMMIVTIGLSLALQYSFQVLIGSRSQRVITASPDTVKLGPVTLTEQSYWAMGISVIVLLAVGYALLRTRFGRATRAVSDNPALAAASGINVDRVIRLVWIVSTALAGLAGILLALVLNGVKWDSGMQILLLLFAAITIGGLGTAFGALVGSLIVGMVVELAPVLGLPGDLKYAMALLILILLLLVRPQGLLGKAQRVG